MKAQLENTQEEVAAGVQGATSDQKGQKRPRKAILAVFALDLWSGYKARANLPGPGRTDPAGYEKNKYIVRTVPFEGMNSDSCSDQVLGVYEPFLKIDARTQASNSL